MKGERLPVDLFKYDPPLYLPLEHNVYDAIEAASVVDPQDGRNFFYHSRKLGRYYEYVTRNKAYFGDGSRYEDPSEDGSGY